MIIIEQLKALNQLGNIAITEHARIRLYERNINVDDIINGIDTGEIIKLYGKMILRRERGANHGMYGMWCKSGKRIYNKCNRFGKLPFNCAECSLL